MRTKYGLTPLMLCRNKEITKFFVKMGANKELIDDKGMTALDYYLETGLDELVQLILSDIGEYQEIQSQTENENLFSGFEDNFFSPQTVISSPSIRNDQVNVPDSFTVNQNDLFQQKLFSKKKKIKELKNKIEQLDSELKCKICFEHR